MPIAVSTKWGREVLKAIKPIVEKTGARCRIDFPKGNHGHHRIVVEYQGHERFSVLSGTPNNVHHTILHKTRDIKKILKELGAIKDA